MRLITLVVLLSCAGTGHALGASRYAGLASTQRTAIAPLPNGYVVGVNGSPNAIVTLDADGEVKAARNLGRVDFRFLTTTPTGEIYVQQSERVLKLRRDLSMIWSRRVVSVDGQPVGFARGSGTRDGGVVFVGMRNAGAVIMKMNRGGDVEWTTGINPSDVEQLHTIRQTRDGGYIAAGQSPRWPWLVRLAADGTMMWQRGYGPGGWLESVLELRDGAILAIGNLRNKPMILKTDSHGEVLWCRVATVSGQGGSLIDAGDVRVASLWIGSPNLIHILAIRDDGSLKWQRVFRPRDPTVLMYEFENLMLAPGRDRVAFTVATGAPASLFSLNTKDGGAGCNWFSSGNLVFEKGVIRSQEVTVEVSAPGLVSRPADMQLGALALSASAEACVNPLQSPAAPAVKTRAFRSTDDDSALKRHYGQLLLAKKFPELEAIAAKLRRERPSRDPMRPNLALATFHGVFADDELAPAETRLARLREWTASSPQSSTAHVALAHALYRAGWGERGSGTGDTVTNTGAAQYQQLITEAQRVLDIAKERGGESDPQYWLLRISLVHQLRLGDVREVGLHALELHPDPEIAARAAGYLNPQWGGSPAVYMKFADDAARVTRSTYGDAMYMWLVDQVRSYESSEEFREYKADWKRVVKGAEDLFRMAPAWLPSYHRLAKLAHKYREAKTARMLFERPELDWYEDAERIWGVREVYDIAREWALQRPPVPPKAITPSKPAPPSRSAPDTAGPWPPTLLDTELTLGGIVHRNLAAFFVETTKGLMAVSVLPRPIAEVRKTFGSWTIRAPGSGGEVARVAAFNPPDAPDYRRGVALPITLKQKLPVKRLLLRREKPGSADPIYLVVCRRTASRCVQEVIPGKLIGSGTAGPKRYVTWYIALSNRIEPNAIPGAAVVDASRRVFAVATGESDYRAPDVKFVIDAEDLGLILEP